MEGRGMVGYVSLRKGLERFGKGSINVDVYVYILHDIS